MARFDKIMHALLAVPKEDALKTMKKTLADKKKKRGRQKIKAAMNAK
ncbi:hypothetical protein [Candidatus Binatus sp.]